MEGWLVLVSVFGLIFALLAFGVPIAFCMLGGGIIGLWLFGGLKLVYGFFSYSLHHLMANYPLAVAPMFILVGTLAEVGGLGERAYNAFHKLLGNLRGGILLATTGAAALFGACCGSSVAGAALFSKVALPELRKLNYQEELSLGTIATAGGLATLIPPSIMAVFYGILTGTSVGKVLMAGIIPGIILTLMIMLAVWTRVKLNPKLAPLSIVSVKWYEKFTALLGIWPVLIVFLGIIGGIYTGFSTPTEAGAVGASIVFLYALMKRIGLKKILDAFREGAAITSQIFIIIIAGMMISKVVSLSGMTNDILEWAVKNNVSLVVFMGILIGMCLILGCIVDPVSMLVLSLPITFPSITGLGFDPVALGIISILLVEVAVITPPVGFNIFVVAAAAGVDPAVAFRGSVMFFFILLAMIFGIIAFPSIATWLPNLVFG